MAGSNVQSRMASGEQAMAARRQSDWQKMMQMFAMANKADTGTMAGFALGKLAREMIDNYNARGQAKKDAAALKRLEGEGAYPLANSSDANAITSAMLASANPYYGRSYGDSPAKAYTDSMYQNAIGGLTNSELAAGMESAAREQAQQDYADAMRGTSEVGKQYAQSSLDKMMASFGGTDTPGGTISKTTYSYTPGSDYQTSLANLFGRDSRGNYF